MRTALICVLIAGFLQYVCTAVAKVLGTRYDNRHVRESRSLRIGLHSDPPPADLCIMARSDAITDG